jgi:hypothetical protein
MCREVIEHPWSLPPSIKKLPDLNSATIGRIYRVGWIKAATTPTRQSVCQGTGGHARTPERLASGHRRALALRATDKTAIAPLARLDRKSSSPLARMHALYALDGLGGLGSTS